ncbi:MAG: DUF2249 domain-containing protein [Gallionellaceae bacterium]|nr:DUF2249 domain-containing protein [Gallionellaceae bacterium]
MNNDILVDGRWLEPPEPMEQVLAALDRLGAGERIRFLIHREPLPLYPMLDRLGYRHEVRMLDDGGFEILIRAG